MYARLLTRSLVLLTITFVVGLYLPARGQESKAELVGELFKDPGYNPHSFTGAWVVQTQITDCDVTTLENFSKFLLINAGGTAQEMSHSVPPSQRTPSFGVWEHLGQDNFVYVLRFFRFSPTGTFTGAAEAKWSVVLAQDGQSYTAEGAIKIISTTGVVLATRCGTETGTRMLIPD